MIENNPSFVSFEYRNGKLVGFLSSDFSVWIEKDPQRLLDKAIKIYGQSVDKLRENISRMQANRKLHKHTTAREVWQIGDSIFELKGKLETLGLQIDGLYDHLERDLAVKRKWLEKVIILRRYISSIDKIPKTLRWGRCEKGTRKKAIEINRGISLE